MKKLLILAILVLSIVGCTDKPEVHEIPIYPLPHESFKARYSDNENGELVKQGEVIIEKYVMMIDRIILYTINGEEITLEHGEDYLIITVIPKVMIGG